MVILPPVGSGFRKLIAFTAAQLKELDFTLHLGSRSFAVHALQHEDDDAPGLDKAKDVSVCGEATPETVAAVSPCSISCLSSVIYEWNTKLRHLVKSRHLHEAHGMFDRMPHRDEISWTTLISGYVAKRDNVEALRLFSRMRADASVAVDAFILSLAMKACGLGQLRAMGQTLHTYSEKVGMKVSSVFVGSALLDMYGKLGNLRSAVQVFVEMPQKNVVSWTSMITSLVHSGWCQKALQCFAGMWAARITCDSYTLAIILKACADAGMLSHGREIHTRALKTGLVATLFVTNALVAMYAKCGRLDCAHILFERMCCRDAVSWTTMISSYVNEGRHGDAVRAYVMMTTGEGIIPNGFTYASVLSACTGLRQILFGEQLHARVLRVGLASSTSVANAIVTMYSSVGRLDAADFMFQETHTRDIVSWSAIICGHAQEGQIEVAFQLLEEMRHGGTTPNEFTLGSILSGCGSVAMLAQGQQLHAHALLMGLDKDATIRSSLVAMYSRCGCVCDAGQLFAGMPMEEVDVISWTAMINGYADNGCSKEAIELFERMQIAGLQPDGITFIGVLTACCHAGLLELGFQYFYRMKEVYGIEPRREHYGCIVDLLGRAGQVEVAEYLAESMPYKPDDVVWSMLLRACSIHGQTDCARRAAKKILEMHPDCAGTHITLSNIYAAKGRWVEAADSRKMMRSKGVRKETGWSWIVVGNGAYVFAAGDRMHPVCEEIYDLLQQLASGAKLNCDPELSVLEFEIEELGATVAL